MDYKNIANVRRMRVYRSTDPELPLKEWKLIADLPVAAMNFNDDLSKEPHIMHYYYSTYVFADGHEGSPSEIKSVMPVKDAKDTPYKQRADLN
jgi:hypothetical protein